ncbi:MAG: serine/threonine-protein kinase [Thermoanaerobaculia bacterium]
MDPRDTRQRLDEIVLHAAALATSERPAYFAELADTEPDLLAEAQRLLAEAAALPTSFLAVPAGDLLVTLSGITEEEPRPAAVSDEPPPLTPEERYEIEEMIGQGGMARVYRAWDKQLERRVALKFLDHPSPAMRRRLVREARAQARVQHRHVLEVYETGEREGTPYIAMRYVAGGTLLEAGDGISLEQKVRLSAQIADALHAAHRQGLLHRDDKPSNVLDEETADQELVPWVTDFGIAVRDEGETSVGSQFAGTPHFLAPERLADGADVDRRSDVYSLGVTMYQLFTGDLPYAATDLIDVLQQIRTAAPRPPRAVMPALPAELEAIVLRCLERDPSARYPSARAVADDLRRYLDGEVVEAYTASVAYRLTRFAIRHRLPLAVAGVAAMALLATLAAFAVTAELQARRIAREAATAHQVTEFLVDLFEISDPGESRGSTVTAREILDRGADEISSELADQPLTRARLMETIGRVYQNLGLYDRSGELLEPALEIRRGILGDDHLEVAATVHRLGLLAWLQGRYDASEELLRKALAVREASLGPDHPEVAEVLGNLGQVYKARQYFDEAEAFHRRALAIREKALGPDHPEVADNLDALASVLSDSDQEDEAETLARRALEIRERTLGADHPDVADSHNTLAAITFYLGRHEQTAEHLRRVLEIRHKTLGEEHPDVAQALHNLALLHAQQAELAAAEARYLRALEIWEAKLGAEHRSTALTLYALGQLYRDQEDREADAERVWLRALASWEAALGSDSTRVAHTLTDLANLYRDQGRKVAAEPFYRRAMAIWEIRRELNPQAEADLLRDFALLLRAAGRETEAVELTARAAEIDSPEPAPAPGADAPG